MGGRAGPLAYWEWASTAQGPDIVCVHGVGASHRLWDPVGAALSCRGRVLAVDLPGSGSSPRRARVTVAGAQGALSGFLRAAVEKPCVLVGTSFGGAVVARQAATEPGSVRGMVLGSSYLPPVYGGWRSPAVVGALLAERIGAAGRAVRAALLRSAVPPVAEAGGGGRSDEGGTDGPGAHTDAGPAASRPWAERWWAQVESVASLIAMSVRLKSTERLYDSIRCPVLLLHGEEDSQVPLSWARAARHRHPGWELHSFPGVPHVVKLGDPSRWLEAVEDWLDRLPDRT